MHAHVNQERHERARARAEKLNPQSQPQAPHSKSRSGRNSNNSRLSLPSSPRNAINIKQARTALSLPATASSSSTLRRGLALFDHLRPKIRDLATTDKLRKFGY
jgi:hypothetical protein